MVQFSKEEVQVILQLCDFALRGRGLEGVNAILPIASKCSEALAAEQKKEAE